MGNGYLQLPFCCTKARTVHQASKFCEQVELAEAAGIEYIWFTSTEARWLIRDGDGGRGGGGDERVKARSRIPPEKDRRDRCCRQNNGSVKAVSPRHYAATSALRNCCFNCRAGQSHKDSVHCTAVEEQLEAKEVQLSQPSSTSLLMISSGLT